MLTLRAAALAALLAVPSVALAHPGGLDSNGCHHDRANGGYHCHGAPTTPSRTGPAGTGLAPQAPQRTGVPAGAECRTEAGVKISTRSPEACARFGGTWSAPAVAPDSPPAPRAQPAAGSWGGFLFEATDDGVSPCVRTPYSDPDVLRQRAARRHGAACRASQDGEGAVHVRCAGPPAVMIMFAPTEEHCGRMRESVQSLLGR